MRNADAPSGVLVGISDLGAPKAVKAEHPQGSVPALHVLVVDDDCGGAQGVRDDRAGWAVRWWGRRAWRRRGRF